MDIGKLLKQYRLEQGKTQAEFVGKIISRSYYAKIEKDKHQINAVDLIDLLDHNKIDLSGFFIKLDKGNATSSKQILHQRKLMETAYYKVNLVQMQKIKQIIDSSELSKNDKDEQDLLVDGFIELLKDGKPNVSLRKKMKEKIFEIPEFNQTKFMLYVNSMRFYTLEDNNVISRQLIRKYKNSENAIIQKDLLSIVINILVFSIEQNNFKNVEFYLSYVSEIPTTPDIFFYKSVSQFFECLIRYMQSGRKEFLKKCDLMIDSISISGMENYSSELAKFKVKYQ